MIPFDLDIVNQKNQGASIRSNLGGFGIGILFQKRLKKSVYADPLIKWNYAMTLDKTETEEHQKFYRPGL